MCFIESCVFCYVVVVFKQRTAYEMRISDWSSDVCSSDRHDGGTSWTRQLDGRSLGKLLVKWYAAHRPEGWDDDRYARLQADAQRFADEGPDQPFLDVWFADADHGYIVGAFNLLLATSDGGEHWKIGRAHV